jgi:hypothetical protein
MRVFRFHENLDAYKRYVSTQLKGNNNGKYILYIGCPKSLYVETVNCYLCLFLFLFIFVFEIGGNADYTSICLYQLLDYCCIYSISIRL